MTLYVNRHVSQLDKANSPITRSSGCTWTTLRNGVDAATHGETQRTPDRIHALVKPSEEQFPATPGWSLVDADKAMGRLGVPFRNLTGGRWEGVRHEHKAGLYIVLQGDSDQFGNGTCSGAFDGDHCIGIHPRTRISDAGMEQWWIDDPICPDGRWALVSTLREYAEKLDHLVRYGVFSDPVPDVNDPILRFGAKALPKPERKTIRVGHPPVEANVRAKPTTHSRVLNTRKSGGKWTAYQVTHKGEKIDGSSVWYGNRRGVRWLHESAF